MSATPQPQISGPDDLQRRMNRTAFLMGAGVAAWLVPIAALVLGGSHDLLLFSIGLASTGSICSFVATVFYGSQRRGFLKWQHYDEQARLEREQLREEIGELRDALHLMSQQLHTRIGQVGLTVTQENFNAFGQGVVVGLGGEEKVQGYETRRLPDAQVYRMPLHSNRGHNGRN
jgi:hypothetical protein